ncbi:TPA: hypothetical protein N0F65_006358 [Lagenidium giganteum]|uniref:Phosphatase PP2A regulatory subunit A/Splicing factor 3B subunit 1-like HEAT repeat domain-containing protein n=1 Tax=Lagenidium giganteum TaxID=4803 RepID=A0AAV2YX06_9STRA|nr:TPA: hypothetical protein N0F65_006358 [Lagenidium giganteum]
MCAASVMHGANPNNSPGCACVAADDDVYPIALLTDDLKNDEVETRIKSIRRLKVVAQALGPERARSELVPFLQEATEDEDEVLAALAEELGGLVDLVGGAQHASVLVEPLEVLAGVEETVVRDRAVESLQKIVDVMPNTGDVMTPMIKRLAEGDWFTSRVSACSLIPPVYGRATDANQKKELRDLFQLMCNDDTPMVRRAAATNIGKFAGKLEKEHISTLVLPLFKALTSDDQDSVRLLAIENSAPIGELLSQEENTQNILPVIRSSVEDRSWRVRFSVAKEFFALSKAMGSQITESELLACFTNLLQDAEAEVRAASAKNIAGYITIVKNELFTSEILPLLSSLTHDTAPNVRTAVSIACMELAPKLGEAAAKTHLSPLLTLFLRDEVVDVRLNILKRLDCLSQWMSSFEGILLPAIADLARDLQWRVREAVILSIPSLAGSLGSQYFQEHLLEIYVSAFTDMVGEVRLSATKILPQLLDNVGSDYIVQNILPRIATIFERSTIYQERVNVLHAFKQMAGEKASAELLSSMITLSMRGAKDKIPNVRFVASLTLEKLCKYADASVVSGQVRPCLQELVNDSDADVKYYASNALEVI